MKRSVRDESGSGMQRAWDAANEAFSLSCMAGTGSLWVIYPYCNQEDGQMAWYSLADRLPYSMPQDERVFVRKWMSYVAEKVMEKRYVEVVELVGKLRAYQQKVAGDVLPSASRFQAEKWYNRFNNDRLFAMFCLAVGLLAFVSCCFRMVAQRHLFRWMPRLLDVLLIFVFIYLGICRCPTVLRRCSSWLGARVCSHSFCGNVLQRCGRFPFWSAVLLCWLP